MIRPLSLSLSLSELSVMWRMLRKKWKMSLIRVFLRLSRQQSAWKARSVRVDWKNRDYQTMSRLRNILKTLKIPFNLSLSKRISPNPLHFFQKLYSSFHIHWELWTKKESRLPYRQNRKLFPFCEFYQMELKDLRKKKVKVKSLILLSWKLRKPRNRKAVFEFAWFLKRYSWGAEISWGY